MAKKRGGWHPIDSYVGRQLRAARCARGFSQQHLGSLIAEPITFQQIQKYERGLNRISASMLHELTQVLRVPVSYFYPTESNISTPLLNQEEAALLEHYRTMRPDQQSAVRTLLVAMGKS